MCPDCRNNGYLVAFVDGPNHSGVSTITCSRCKGTGLIDPAAEKWVRIGSTHRTWRVAQHESLGECAVRLGITPRELTDMEHGRECPERLIADTPECLR
jgi:hypothetical protein